MNLISDVRHELSSLDLSAKRLKQFGGVVWSYYAGIGMGILIIATLLGFAGIAFGSFMPNALVRIYRVWMLVALILGWFVSRIILAIIFFLIITPIGIVAKLAGKKHIIGHRSQESYWIKRKPDHHIDYKKMY